MHTFSPLFVEKLADETGEEVKKPVIMANINKWEGEDEDDVKVSFCKFCVSHKLVNTCMRWTFTFCVRVAVFSFSVCVVIVYNAQVLI